MFANAQNIELSKSHHRLSIVQSRIRVNCASVIRTDPALFSCVVCAVRIHLRFLVSANIVAYNHVFCQVISQVIPIY